MKEFNSCPWIVAAVMLAFLGGCGDEQKAIRTTGGACDANGGCDPGLECDGQGICQPTIRQPTVTVNVTSTSLLSAAGINSCAEQTTVASELQVKGFVLPGNDCDLAVNPNTFTTSGSCVNVWTGGLSSLIVWYSLADPVSSTESLVAFLVGGVDLTTQGIGSADTVSVDVPADGVSSAQLNTNAELIGLCDTSGVAGCVQLPASAQGLCLAKCRLQALLSISANEAPFDLDSDGTSNLQEACDGTLFH